MALAHATSHELWDPHWARCGFTENHRSYFAWEFAISPVARSSAESGTHWHEEMDAVTLVYLLARTSELFLGGGCYVKI